MYRLAVSITRLLLSSRYLNLGFPLIIGVKIVFMVRCFPTVPQTVGCVPCCEHRVKERLVVGTLETLIAREIRFYRTGRCATSFPSDPSWAATFDRQLIRKMAAVVGRETRAGFNSKTWLDNGREGAGAECWGPVININRDPRWGRNGEGGAEDPYLMGQLAEHWTFGLQQGDTSSTKDPNFNADNYIQVAVTLKHFVANALEGGSPSDKGLNRHTVDVNLTK